MRLSFLGPFGFHPNKTMRSRALPLARALVARGHQVQLVMPPWQTPAEAGRRWTEDGVEIVYVNLSGGIVPTVGRMIRTADDFQPDLIHTFKPKAYSGLAMWVLWQRRRLFGRHLPLLTDTDDWEGWGGWNDIAPYSPLQKRFFAWQERWGLTHADRLTVASRELARRAAGLGQPAAQILYLPNGPGIPLSDPVRLADITARRAALGLGERPTVVLYSRLFEFDVTRLTTLLAGVKAVIPDLAILSIGTGLYQQDGQALHDQFAAAGLLDQVVDLGWLAEEELPLALLCGHVGLYLMDDTLLNRTKCPVKLADLVASGLPVVGEAVGQVSEYVENGLNGLLRPSGDVAGLTADLIALLQNPGRRAAMGHSGRERWQAAFSWARQAERYEEGIGRREKGEGRRG